MAAILPLSNAEVFPSYKLLTAGAHTLAADSVVIAVEDFVAADALELAEADGNAGEFVRSVLLSAKAAQDARPVAERPTRSVVAQQAGVTDAGVDAVSGIPLATNNLLLTTTFLVGSAEGGSIAPEPTA